MTNQFTRAQNFLLGQSFYPILLSSAFALSIYAVRALYSRSWVIYANLVWNLILAWVPYVFSILAASLHYSFPRRWWLPVLPGMIWLVFFPNAPYIMTDFLHLSPRTGIPLWYDIILLAAFSLTGFFLAIASLRTMQGMITFYLGKVIGWVFAFFVLALSGLGMYLGRFDRWNSWDLLFYPKSILADVATRLINPFENMRFFGFTILFTMLLLVCYLTFVSMRPLEEPET